MKVNKDRAVGIAFAVMGALIIMMASGITITQNLSEPGPRLFPYISGGGIFICGVGMALTKQKEEQKQAYLDRDGWKRMVMASALMIVYYLGLNYLGFLISTPIFMFLVIWLLASGKKINLIFSIALSVLTTGLLYVLFKQAFMIFLPTGKLF